MDEQIQHAVQMTREGSCDESIDSHGHEHRAMPSQSKLIGAKGEMPKA